MTIKSMVVIAAATVLLNGCIFRDRSDVYQRSGSLEPIELPQDLNVAQMEPLYPIPRVQRADDAFYDIETDGFVIPRPEPMSAEREAAKVKIQKVGDRRWILAEAPTSQVWPLAQSYLSTLGVDVASSTPATGLIQTDWVVLKAEPEIQNRFRIRIEKGVRADTTEIHVLQKETKLNSGSAGQWPERSDNLEREAWLLDGLANALASNIDNKAASLLGQSVGGEVKAELFMADEEPTLRLRMSRERAWATLAHSLGKEGFKAWDEDSVKGVFYVQYIDPQKKRSWFKRWFVPEREAAATTAPHSLSAVLQHLAPTAEVKAHFAAIDNVAYGDALDNSSGYLILLQPNAGDFVVTIRSARGERLGLQRNKQLLSVIRRNLI